jgi:hypothetical protein
MTEESFHTSRCYWQGDIDVLKTENIGNWAKSSDTFGDATNYSLQSERYGLEFLQHYLRLDPSDVRHIGGGDEPDGVLSTNSLNFAIVEVRLHMELFPDVDQPNGSGWPQVREAIDGRQSIPLDLGLGTWALWVTPNAGAIRRLLDHPQTGTLLSGHISQSLALGIEQPVPGQLLALADIEEIFALQSGVADECIVIPHVQPYGGFFTTSLDHISSYMQQRIARWTESTPTKNSFVNKWADRASRFGVSELHVVCIFENTKEWMKAGIMHQLVDPSSPFPSTPLDLTGFPPLNWNLWLLLRNPNDGNFHKAFRYSDSTWTVMVE